MGVEVQLYSFFNLGARWGGWSTPRSGRFTSRERHGTPRIGSWVDPRAGVKSCGKSRPHRDWIPGPSSPQRVAIPTELSRHSSQFCIVPESELLGQDLKISQRLFFRSFAMHQSTFPCRLTLTFSAQQSSLYKLIKTTYIDVFLTVHHSIDFSKYQLRAKFF